MNGIPPKSSFRFQELPSITDVKPYVLRFWETEFPEINPVTDESGEKRYARSDVEAILRIRDLLFEKKLSIAEAKLFLRQGVESAPSEPDGLLEELRGTLEHLRETRQRRGW